MSGRELKALLTEKIHEQAEVSLQEMAVKTRRLNKAATGQELIEHLKDIQILCARSRTLIDKEVLSQTDLECIAAFCIGVNQIDLEEASQRGIPVFNAPYGNTRSVAEMVLGLIIGLSRSLFIHSKNMKEGKWKKFTEGCFEIRGKTLGIIGYGNIGSQISVLAEALGMKVLYYDIVSKLPMGNAKPVFHLKNLLKESDFVTLHVPETPQTKNMFGKKEMDMMKKNSYLINSSRGTVVDLEALKTVLESGHLSGAAIDVFPKEPKTSEDSFSHPLQKMESVILSPHIGGSTQEAQVSIVYEVSKSLKDFLQTGTIQNSVNFPSLLVPSIPENTTRICNIHKNQPGVLSQINKLVSESGANIKSQYLATNKWVGYLVMDLEKGQVENLKNKISQIDVSFRTRVLSPKKA